jgi:hypothetical protein
MELVFLLVRLGQVLEKEERKGKPGCGLDSHGSRYGPVAAAV